MPKNAYTTQALQAQQTLAALEAQAEAIRAQLGEAQANLNANTKKTASGQLMDTPGYQEAKDKLEKTQMSLNNKEKEILAARADVAKLADLNNQDTTQDSATEQNAVNLLQQRMDNQKKGKGYLTDAEITAQTKADADKGEARADRDATRAVSTRGQDLQASMEANRLAWDKQKTDIDAALKRGELTLKEAELKLNQAFNERKVAMENIQNEMKAAAELNTMAVTQRAQDINSAQGGEQTASGVMKFVGDMIGFMAPGQEISHDQLLGIMDKYDKWVEGRGESRVRAREAPNQTTVDTAAGKNRVGGVEEERYTTKEAQAAREAKKGTVTDPAEAFDLAIQQRYAEWASAKKESGDTSPNTLEAFKEHIKALGPDVPTDEAIRKIPAFQAPGLESQAPATTTGVAPDPVNTNDPHGIGPSVPVQTSPSWMPPRSDWRGEIAAIPSSHNPNNLQGPMVPGGQPASVTNNYIGVPPPTAPAPDPAAGVAESMKAQVNQGVKQEFHEGAAVDQTMQMLKDGGVSQEVMQAFAQKHGYDPAQAENNPFNQYLNQQLQQPLT